MEPMVRLLAHRGVDAAGLGVEIGRRLGEREAVRLLLYSTGMGIYARSDDRNLN